MAVCEGFRYFRCGGTWLAPSVLLVRCYVSATVFEMGGHLPSSDTILFVTVHLYIKSDLIFLSTEDYL